MTAPYVAVVGTGESAPETDALAETVGRLLAERGAILVCGGLGGVMAAAARGAAEAGGLTVGLLPGDERRHANPHIKVALPTGLGEMRNPLIARVADALIAVGGGFGTLSEVAFALRIGRPVVTLRSWDLGASGRSDLPPQAASAEEAVALALEASRRAGAP